MSADIRESDWKIFRELREVALDRFCQKVLSDMVQAASDGSRGHHERYLAVYELIRERDKELAGVFDSPRRSVAMMQLAAIRARKLLTDEEFARFSPETRTTVGHWLEI